MKISLQNKVLCILHDAGQRVSLSSQAEAFAGAEVIQHERPNTPEAITETLQVVYAEHQRLDALLNIIAPLPETNLLNISAEDWAAYLRQSVSTAFWATQSAGRLMQGANATDGGSIIHVFEATHPTAHLLQDTLEMLTLVSARSLAPHQLRVNAVLPRGADPANWLASVCFLLQNDFITGAVLRGDSSTLPTL